MIRAMFVAPVAVSGGVANVLEGMVRHADAGGYDPSVVFLREGPAVAALRATGVPVLVLDAGRMRSARALGTALRSVGRRLDADRPDVLVGMEPSAQIYTAIPAFRRGIPVVWQQHGLPSSRSPVERLARALPARAAIANSRHVAARLTEMTTLRVPVVTPGVDLDRFTATRHDERAAHGVPSDVPLVGIVARLQPWKGQDLFLHMAARLADADTRVRFVVVGGAEMGWERGDYPGELRDLAEQLGLAGRVTFTGHVDDPAAWMAACDVLVSASDHEPYGLTVCEAQAAGTAIVATVPGGPAEIITDGHDGLLVAREVDALAGAVAGLLADPARRAALVQAGRQTAERRHGGARMAAELGRELRRVTGAGHPTSVLMVAPVAVAGGAAENLLTLVRHAPPDRYVPRVICLSDGPIVKRMRDESLEVRVVPGGRLRSARAVVRTTRALNRHLRADNPDVVFSTEAKAQLYAALPAWWNGVPAVWRQPSRPSRRSAIDQVAARLPARTIVVASDFIARRQRAVRSATVRRIVPGIDAARFAGAEPIGRELRREHGFGDSVVAVGIVGRLERWKGQALFLRAALIVARRHAQARFVLVGGAEMGWERAGFPAELRTQAEQSGLGPVTTFTGHVDSAAGWYSALDIVVHASEGEPFGMVVPEAMLMGRAVVTVPEGGPLEIVEHGVTGLIADARTPEALAAQIGRLVGDAALRDRLGAAAHATAVTRFGHDRMVSEFADLLDGVAA